LPGVIFREKFLCLYLFFFLCSNQISGQGIADYEETAISLKIPKIGVVETPAYVRNEVLYLPVTDIFTFLKIQNTPSPGYDSVSGFFINQQSVYLIDRAQNRIHYQNKVFELTEGDLVRTEDNLYLRSEFFGQVFGLNITFDFRSLTATLSTNFELPLIREMRMELMRNELSRLKGEIKADTVIGRRYPLFHFGMADWSVITTQQITGKNTVGLTLALGSVIAGGEANVSLTYSNQQDFAEKHQYYLWHYANNDRPALRQVKVGKIGAFATSSIFSPIVGIQLTNTPTTFRRSFGTYTLTDYTEPGWVVELYVNNVLVDYMKADASGFFTFEVPLVYGTSAIILRFYGPWGEERSREKSISIPFNFLPPRKLEYTVTAAMVEDASNNIFSRANVNYGLNQRITIGGGVEYLSSVIPSSTMPFINLSLRLASSLLIQGEYSYGVRFKGILSYRLPLKAQLELNYFRYHKGQTAVSTNYIEERKLMISVPFRLKRTTSLMRLTLDQVLLLNSRNFTADLLISTTAFGISANLTTIGLFHDPVHPYIYSTLSLGFRLPAKFILIPQTQFDYTHTRFLSMKAELERQMFEHCVLRMSYEHNFAVNIQNIQIGMRYDFPIAQTGFSAMSGNKNISFAQSARGSLMVDARSKWIGSNNLTNVGKGGLVLVPFLDMNVNGRRDDDEPKVIGLNIHITGGRIEQNKRDSTIRVFDLEPFTSYFIEIDRNSFDNVSWQIKKSVISAAIDPNQFKLVEVPVAVFGEGSGMVYMKKDGSLLGQGRIIVSFYRKDSTLAGRTLTEADGYFSFLGLAPGNYYVKVEDGQMRKLGLSVTPGHVDFTLAKIPDGDLAGGLDFVLEQMATDLVPVPEPGPLKPVVPAAMEKTLMEDQDEQFIQDVVNKNETSRVTIPQFTIQVATFRDQEHAIKTKVRIHEMVDLPVTVVFDSGLYVVRIEGIKHVDITRQLLMQLLGKGYSGAFILNR